MVPALHSLLWLGSLVPRVDDPLPHRVGLGLPFTFAGAGSVLGELVIFHRSAAKRDRAARIGSLLGFAGGALIYTVALASQLLSP